MIDKGGKSPALLSPPRGNQTGFPAERACRKASSTLLSIAVKGRSLLAAPFVCALRKEPFLQVLFVALDHLFDHLAADGTGLARGQIAVVALLEVDADLPWCTPNILKCSFSHVFAIRKGGMVPSTSQCGTGSTLLCRKDTIGVTCGFTGQLWQETLGLEGPPAHR